MLKISKIFAGVITLAAASVSFGASTVGVLDPNLTEGTTTGFIQNSPVGSSVTGFIPLATFRPLVLAAFNANTGGVMDFNEASTGLGSASFPSGTFGAAGSPLAVTYGTSQALSIGIERAAGVTGTLDAGTGNTAYASGINYLGTANGSDPGIVLTPPTGFGVTTVGFTILERGAARSPVVNFVLSNGTTVALTTAASPDSLGVNGPSIFYGYQAPADTFITRINFSDATAGNLLRTDDYAFITAAVPEPTSVALLGLGGVAVLRRRRA